MEQTPITIPAWLAAARQRVEEQRKAEAEALAAVQRSVYFQQQLSEEADKAWSDLQRGQGTKKHKGPCTDYARLDRNNRWVCLICGDEISSSTGQSTALPPIAGLSFLPDVAKHSHQVAPGHALAAKFGGV
jgi:hypothetical protein